MHEENHIEEDKKVEEERGTAGAKRKWRSRACDWVQRTYNDYCTVNSYPLSRKTVTTAYTTSMISVRKESVNNRNRVRS